MNEGLIPSRYAKALYKFATEKGSAQKVYNELGDLVNSFSTHPALGKAMGNPALPARDKEQLLATAMGGNPDDSLLRFVRLVIRNRRESFMRAIALTYQSIYRDANNIARITVVTAVTLGNEVLDKIKALMQSKTDKTLEFVYVTDPSIIGGFILKVDSMQLDASVNNELKKLRLKLINSK
ncbi:MAG: F0F1 ATP synthase subunit delta [Barnesiella sp.]